MIILIFTGPWKKKALVDLGTFTQCLSPQRVNEQYLNNLLLKINVKVIIGLLLDFIFLLHVYVYLIILVSLQLGGVNYQLAVERNIPLFTNKPTIIFGMDVSHGSPGQSGVPSIAAVTFPLLHLCFFCSTVVFLL